MLDIWILWIDGKPSQSHGNHEYLNRLQLTAHSEGKSTSLMSYTPDVARQIMQSKQ